MKKTLTITQKIFIGLGLGILTGILLYYFVPAGVFRDTFLIEGVFYVIGTGFMRLLQMLVVPLVFFSLATGALSMGDTASIGKIGIKTLVFYMFTTSVAIGIALLLSNFIKPGLDMDLTSVETVAVEINEAPSAIDTLLGIIPTNPIEAMAQGNMLGIIFFALLVGLICAMIPEELTLFTRILNEGNSLMMKMTSLVMKVAPFGVFALIARTFSQLGFETFLPMMKYMAAVVGALILHVGFVYIPLLILLARVNPITFVKKFAGPMTFAFSSASSGATIPLTLDAMDEMGVPRKISAFTIPLGATINMDGTAIMQGCAVVFISFAYGIPLSFADFVTVILTATLASVGTAAVPGVGLITLSMVLRSVGLPVEGIAMIMGIDRILDMLRTAVNTTGDATVTMIVAKQDGSLNLDQFNSTIPIVDSDEF